MLKQTKWLAVLLAAVLMLGSCAQVGGAVLAARVGMPAGAGEVAAQPEAAPGLSASAAETHPAGDEPAGEYREGTVLVKYDGEMTDHILDQLGLVSAERLWSGSEWYTVTIGETRNTRETVAYLRELGCFAQVDYDYIMKGDGEVASVDVSSNPEYTKQEGYLDTLGVGKAWNYIRSLGKHPGGSADVVVAVIDTGVDYSHPDLQNNIWINSGEIPGNGIDDDGNGYVDDVYGWNFVGGNNDPMDDNGHGTHVAGIVAMENNAVGGVGVAYNSKVMVLKAGNSSGYFNNSDIAEAIQYAYMNGASVINMSFGGSMISLAVEEALQMAYNSCVLVAAAGNDGLCNQIGCPVHLDARASYPAALPYVIGVMSCDALGLKVSSFSNYDHYPYNNVEYETFACGEMVFSTWPNGKYALLSGTSMATPTVAGIAAVLRAAYPDRNTYSTKYLQSQIVNTGSLHSYNSILKACDDSHSVANVYEAMTKLPTPDVNLYDYYFFDSKDIDGANNGDGVIDAGETIRIAIELYNRGGVASNVLATLDTIRNRDTQLIDPYITIKKDSIPLGNIGTYSVRDCGKIYENDEFVSTTLYFEIFVASDCPNDYLSRLNLHLAYENGLNEKDTAKYSGTGIIQLTVRNGVVLPREIKEDMILTDQSYYIVSSPVLIHPDVKVTVESGTQITYSGDGSTNRIVVGGELLVNGTENDLVELNAVVDKWNEDSNIVINYAKIRRACKADKIDHCIIWSWYGNSNQSCKLISNSVILRGAPHITSSKNASFENCVFVDPSIKYWGSYYKNEVESYGSSIQFNNCVFYTPYSYEMIPRVTSFAPGTTNALLNLDYRAISLAHSVNGIGGKDYSKSSYRSYISMYAPMYDSSKTIEENTYQVGALYWGTSNKNLIESYVFDFYDDPNWGIIDKSSFLSNAPENVWPFVTNVSILNSAGEKVSVVSKEEVTFVVEFNRDMNMETPIVVKFGSVEPYSDYVVTGNFVSPRRWEGKYSLTSNIENGIQYLNISGGAAADDSFLTLYEISGRFVFNIDTTATMSMMLQAHSNEEGMILSWEQDEYDTLMGYNIYRSESKDGNYTRLNTAVLPFGTESFIDTNAEPGKTYWYTFTVVLSDFSETAPAGRVSATALDTLAPSLYHTPVNQGYLGNNLVISCTASDNVSVSAVTLFFRTKGTTEWTARTMSRVNDKYSATVFGSELTADGLEYYILASDGRNTVAKGSEETPYQVVVKDASLISRLGDVDGDGVISAKDALMILQHIGGEVLLTDDQFRRADLNSDGELSAVEALCILQFINGKVTSLAM